MNQELLEENDKLKRLTDKNEISAELEETKDIKVVQLPESQVQKINKETEHAEESKEPLKATSRGNSEIQMPFQSNYIIIYGCGPGYGIIAATHLTKDVMDCLTQKYDKLSQTVLFPTVIRGLRGSDTSIEYVTTLTLQTIRMAIKNFTAVRKTAFIFVQTELKIHDQ